MLLLLAVLLLTVLLLTVLLVWVGVLLVLRSWWVGRVATIGVIALIVLAVGGAVALLMLLSLAVLIVRRCWVWILRAC